MLYYAILTLILSLNPGESAKMTFYTIGYGGREPAEFVELLKKNGVRTVVDVRLKPGRAYRECYVKAKTPGAGIEKLLADAGIGYIWLPELGNVYMKDEDWWKKYEALIEKEGDQRTRRLADVEKPFCFLCAEKRSVGCHRKVIADYLVKEKDWKVENLE